MPGGFHGRGHERGDPAVRAQFGDGLRHHNENEHGQQNPAKGFGNDGKDRHHRARESPNHAAAPAKDLAELGDNQAEANQGAEHAEFF